MKSIGQNGWIRLATALIACAVPGHAQQPNNPPSHWRENFTLGKQLLSKGLYREAEKPLQAALEEIEKAPPVDYRLITSLNGLADLRFEQGMYHEAEVLLRRALEVGERVVGADNLELAITLNSLGLVDAARGSFADAERFYRHSLAIVEHAFGPEHPEVAMRLDNLAELYREMGRYSEAEPLYRRALEVAERSVASEHPQTAIFLNNLATLYRTKGAAGESEKLYRRALAIEEKALGPEHPQTAATLDNLAVLCGAAARQDEALALARRALNIREKMLGPEHPDVARSLNTLATLFYRRHWYGEAEPLLQRSLSVMEKSLGADHSAIVGVLNNLAVLYGSTRRYTDAEKALKRSLEIREKSGNIGQVRTAQKNLTDLYLISGQFAEAEPRLRVWLEVSEKELAPNDPELAKGYRELAFALRKLHRKSEAARSEARAKAILRDNKPHSGMRPETPLKIEVRLYNYSGVTAEVLARAEQETARIYRRVGVEMEWRNCLRTADELEKKTACDLPTTSTKFTLRLLSKQMAQRFPVHDDIYGFALLSINGGFGVVANVFADRAREIPTEEETRGVILGHLIAHELGHLLLGEAGHPAAAGVMHTPWQTKELEQIKRGVMYFLPEQTEKIRSQVLARTISETAAAQR